MQSPMFISRRANLRRLYLHSRRLDILSELLATRPDTKWVPVLLTNVQFFIFSTFYPVGNGILPQYLIEKRSMYSLVIKQNGKKYEDNLCLFRCLAVHNGYDLLSLETPTKDYYKKWVKLTKPSKQFSGVAIEQFPDFETCYKVNLEVYSLGEDGTYQSIYKSRGRHDSTLYVNLYENHASYIKNLSCYAIKFQCKTCERHFPTSFNLHRHQAICDNKTKYVYPGGFFKSNQTVFKKLEHYDVNVPVEDRSFPWFIVYDFEAMLQKVEQDQTQHLKWTQRHIPVSVSICSNVPGYNEPCCIINSDTDQLVSSMIEYMQQITNKVGDLAKEKWGWILDKLTTEECTGGSDDVSVKMQKSANQRILAEFEKYQTQVPVLGFNSAKYDVNLIRNVLAEHLCLHQDENFVVKKNNAYMCISSPNLKFMDIMQFLAPGTSYSKFLKAYGVEEQKGFFPYEWFDDISKLNHTELPPHDSFYSSLKKH
ncbi:hypothetical protein KUTeg_021994 [Tegillarca granosa]|uniref:DNA-directed DNA polymerase n=1 Tax=Tegillarca granosa TaxID=220873 RepID=A0ABQ9EAF8_TEGGR|nr:hypothetical protein KUTeg_021994 [Tegillarca granosa]